MKVTCPVCDASFRPTKLGVVLPCPSCGNPVAIPAEAPPEPKRGLPPPPQTAAERGADPGQIPWGLAGIVVVVLAVAHYALYLLITQGARDEIEELEAKHGPAIIRTVENPGGTPPPASSPKYKTWHEQRELYLGAKAYSEHEAHRSLVANGLLISILVQLSITGFALFRIKSRLDKAAARPPPRRSSAGRGGG